MKHKIYMATLALGALASSCADEFDQAYSVAKPKSLEDYAYLADYKPLRDYVTNPNFKLGGALEAGDFNSDGAMHQIAATNFNEIVAGNAMKMSSCVDEKGNMNFNTVSDFVNKAEVAGVSVFGHTLAWHAQQPKKWLESLMKDKELEVDADAKVEKNDYSLDCGTLAGYSWSGNPEQVVTTWGKNGTVEIYNPSVIDPFYLLQYWLVNGITLTTGKEYFIRINMRVEGNSSALIRFKLGDWGGGFSKDITVEPSDDFKNIEFAVTPTMDSNGLFFQHGDFAGTVIFKSVEIFHYEAPSVEIPQSVYTCTFDDGNNVGGWGGSSTREVVSGGHDGGKCHVVHNPTVANPWECQAAIDFSSSLVNGETYYLHFWAKATNAGSRSASYQNPSDYSGRGDYPAFAVSSEWQEYTLKTSITGEDCKRLCFNLGAFDGDIYLDDIEIYYMKKGNSIPLTDEEKKDTLTWALDRWIGGMMEACKGKVKAWDVVNEAVSGADKDGDGDYDLQHADAANADNGVSPDFFWQDYLGDIDYVRIAVASARKHFAANGGNAADLKLFINDYNLESTWDDNKKLKSLINWIDKWEADGVTKIDGIGSQMHVIFSTKAEKQKKQEECVENMLKLMAATGKLVRISELDMGYEDDKGIILETEELTEEQHKQMAAYYNFIVRKYLEIVPADQQYGITQWCLTDSPASSSWRTNWPTGLWDLNYDRKHTYGGFAEGLQGKEYNK
ncbi:MAG: endo-1,4-beta-xylanase [Marinilabiliaceae bacterium]|nr:endo-1,4-beta-xylanase [Marinilabiliaceae bacterium]